jgi:hypothetical protein
VLNKNRVTKVVVSRMNADKKGENEKTETKEFFSLRFLLFLLASTRLSIRPEAG